MSRERVNTLLDFGNPQVKRKLIGQIAALHGVYEVELAPRRPSRTIRQNAYYWAAVVTPFFDFLRDQDERITRPEQAHDILKAKFLVIDKVDDQTGEIRYSFTRSTTDLDTAEFSSYVDRCRSWLVDFFGIVTLEAGETGMVSRMTA